MKQIVQKVYAKLRNQAARSLPATMVVVAVGIVGCYTLLNSHATTPTVSQEPELGQQTGTVSVVQDNTASGGQAVQFQAAPLLGGIGSGSSNATLSSSGFREVVIAAGWKDIEPTQGGFSASAINELQTRVNAARAAGLSPSLDIGMQYAPSWIFSVGGGTQFIDQNGTAFTGSATSGNYVPNAVTNSAVRTELASYLSYLGSHVTGLDSVRLGGGPLNELRYPSGNAITAGGNSFWFYDVSSQALLPSNVKGWKPGTGTAAQAATFIAAYNNALTGYGAWLVNQGVADFPASTKLEVLLPDWGERPGEVAAAIANLLANAPTELTEGSAWSDLFAQLPTNNQVVAYSTWADATIGTAQNPSPAEYIHNILPAGILAGGESTGNGNTTNAGMNLMFAHAKQWHWYVANWFFAGQPQTPADVAASFANAE